MFRNQTFNIIYFLTVFISLSVAFYVYIGIVSPGGKIYSQLLDKYANFPAWFTYLICKSAKGLLELAGYDVYQKKPNNITIQGSRGINIIWACLGFQVMSFWIAFITAHHANRNYKVKWITIGVSIITGINIIRMALIALGLHYDWKTFNGLDVHTSFNIVSYIAIFGLMFWFISRYKKYKRKEKGNIFIQSGV